MEILKFKHDVIQTPNVTYVIINNASLPGDKNGILNTGLNLAILWPQY